MVQSSGLIIEYDGGHHASLKQRHQDARHRDALREHGWDVRGGLPRSTCADLSVRWHWWQMPCGRMDGSADRRLRRCCRSQPPSATLLSPLEPPEGNNVANGPRHLTTTSQAGQTRRWAPPGSAHRRVRVVWADRDPQSPSCFGISDSVPSRGRFQVPAQPAARRSPRRVPATRPGRSPGCHPLCRSPRGCTRTSSRPQSADQDRAVGQHAHRRRVPGHDPGLTVEGGRSTTSDASPLPDVASRGDHRHVEGRHDIWPASPRCARRPRCHHT